MIAEVGEKIEKRNEEQAAMRAEVERESESDEKDDNGESGEESQEGRKSVGRKSPKEPTRAEKEEHERTHCPYRSWCEHCVRSRARNAPHRKSTPEEPLEEVKVPRVHMDYFFMSRENEGASSNPLLVVADEKSGSRYARVVGVKGLG